MKVLPFKYGNQFLLASVVIFLLKCSNQITHAQDDDLNMSSLSKNNERLDDLYRFQAYGTEIDLTNKKFREISTKLAKLLLVSWPKDKLPILYVEHPGNLIEYNENKDFEDMIPGDVNDDSREAQARKIKNAFSELEYNDINSNGILRPLSPKRSKYYRQFPLKRQATRYEPAFVCSPRKDDVYRLLAALHVERYGKRGQLVNFCNRKRPALHVYHHIRYVG